jgi:hypothetical protein
MLKQNNWCCIGRNTRPRLKLNGLIALLQNFSNIEETIELSKPINFGLVNSINMARIELQINY